MINIKPHNGYKGKRSTLSTAAAATREGNLLSANDKAPWLPQEGIESYSPTPPWAGTLDYYDYQKKGIGQILAAFEQNPAKVFLLADDMGVGKTMQALGVMVGLNLVSNVLIISTKTSCKAVWAPKLPVWAPFQSAYRRLLLYHSKPASFEKNPSYHLNSCVTVLNFDQLVKYGDLFQGHKFDLVIVDEYHRVMNPDANMTRAFFGGDVETVLGKKVIKKRFEGIKSHAYIFCTGTPINRSLMDLCNIFQLFGMFTFTPLKFLSKYATYNIQKGNHTSNLNQFQTFWEDVKQSFPVCPILARPFHYVYPNIGRYVMDMRILSDSNLSEEDMVFLREERNAADKIDVKVLVDNPIAKHEMMTHRRHTSLVKSRMIASDIIDMCSTGEPIVICFCFTESLRFFSKLLSEAGIQHVEVTGAKKDIDAFVKGKATVCLLNEKAGAESISLDICGNVFCKTMALIDYGWSAIELEQVFARIRRATNPSAKLRIMGYHFKGTLDDKIMRVVKGKAQTASVFNNKANVFDKKSK